MQINASLLKRSNSAILPVVFLGLGMLEYFAYQQLIVLCIGSIYLVATAIQSQKTVSARFPEALLITLATFAGVCLVVRQFGLTPSGQIFRTALVIFFIAFSIQHMRMKKSPEQVPTKGFELFSFVGPVLILAGIAYFIGRFGTNFAWAMSGDSRNHVHVARETVEAGGINIISGYPALANAVVGLFGGWRFGLQAPELGELGNEIRILALTFTVFLVGVGFLSGRLIGEVNGKRKYMLGACAFAASSIPLSQLWLRNFLWWGFLPIGLTLILLLAALVIALDEDHSAMKATIYLTLSAELVVLSFPPAAPLIAGPFLVAIGSKLLPIHHLLRRKCALVSIAVIPSGLLWLSASYLPFRSAVFTRLNLDGTITPTNPNALWFLAAPLFAIALLGRGRSSYVASIGLSACSVGLALDHYLRGVLDASYYIEKLRWVTVVLVIIATIAALASVVREAKATATSWLALCSIPVLMFCAFGPVFQKSDGKSTITSFVQGWNHPTSVEAKQITQINDVSPRAIQWRTNPDYVAAQVTNMWQGLGVSGTSTVITWPFRADQFSLPEVCTFAKEHSPITIWVVDEKVAAAVRALCKYEGVTSMGIDSISSASGGK